MDKSQKRLSFLDTITAQKMKFPITLRSRINAHPAYFFDKKIRPLPAAVIRTLHLLILDFQVSLQKNLNNVIRTLVFEIQ